MSTVYLLVGPSGSGKTTLEAELLNEFAGRMERPKGVWTRQYRPGENAATADSLSVSRTQFEKMRKAGQLTGIDEFGGNLYAVPLKNILSIVTRDKDALCIVTIDGAVAIKEAMRPRDIRVLSIFLWAPTSVLRQRLERRGDAPEDIDRRMKHAVAELERCHECDYRIDAEQSPEAVLAEVRAFILKTRLGPRKKCGLCSLPILPGEAWTIAAHVTTSKKDSFVNRVSYHRATCAQKLRRAVPEIGPDGWTVMDAPLLPSRVRSVLARYGYTHEADLRAAGPEHLNGVPGLTQDDLRIVAEVMDWPS